MTGCESAEARGERTKRERRREEKKKKQKKRLGVLARTKEREKDSRGGGGGMEGNYTENISLLEKFSTPLSASIVIYARDEGGYITGFRLRRSLHPRTPRGWTARSSSTRSQKDSPNRRSIPSRTARWQDGRTKDFAVECAFHFSTFARQGAAAWPNS